MNIDWERIRLCWSAYFRTPTLAEVQIVWQKRLQKYTENQIYEAIEKLGKKWYDARWHPRLEHLVRELEGEKEDVSRKRGCEMCQSKLGMLEVPLHKKPCPYCERCRKDEEMPEFVIDDSEYFLMPCLVPCRCQNGRENEAYRIHRYLQELGIPPPEYVHNRVLFSQGAQNGYYRFRDPRVWNTRFGVLAYMEGKGERKEEGE